MPVVELKISWEDSCSMIRNSQVPLVWNLHNIWSSAPSKWEQKILFYLLCLLSFQMELIIIFRISVSYTFTTKVTPHQINSADRWWIDLLIRAVSTENKMLASCTLCVEKWGKKTPVLIHLILKVTGKKTKLGRNVSFIWFKFRKNDKINLSVLANGSRHHVTLGHFLFLNRLQSNLNGASQDYQQFYLFSIIH